MATTLDSVVIDIESQAGHSTANIDKLSTALANLKGSLRGGFNNLNKLNSTLAELGQTSNTTNFSQLADQMRTVADSLAPLKSLNDLPF